MSVFRISPRLQTIDTLDEFLAAFSIGEGDLVITDRCIFESFFKARALKSHFIIQDDFGGGEPNDKKIMAIAGEARKTPYERVIAVGGGTVIDIGKLLSVSGWDDCLVLFRKEAVPVRDKKLVIIPTTCGTGSEVTNIAVVAFEELHTKIGLAVDELFADDAVLIPELLTGLPAKVFMHSSIDALIHAVESFLSPKANPFTQTFAAEAMKMIVAGYKALAKRGMDCRKEYLHEFLLASCYAGLSFSNAGTGIVHAMSYPLGGAYHLPHGEANYEIFFTGLKFYESKKPDGDFKRLLDIIGPLGELEKLIGGLIPRRPMREFGMTAAEAKTFARDVIENQKRLLANNYVPATEAEIEAIFNEII